MFAQVCRDLLLVLGSSFLAFLQFSFTHPSQFHLFGIVFPFLSLSLITDFFEKSKA
jgi:hypothetical protein